MRRLLQYSSLPSFSTGMRKLFRSKFKYPRFVYCQTSLKDGLLISCEPGRLLPTTQPMQPDPGPSGIKSAQQIPACKSILSTADGLLTGKLRFRCSLAYHGPETRKMLARFQGRDRAAQFFTVSPTDGPWLWTAEIGMAAPDVCAVLRSSSFICVRWISARRFSMLFFSATHPHPGTPATSIRSSPR